MVYFLFLVLLKNYFGFVGGKKKRNSKREAQKEREKRMIALVIVFCAVCALGQQAGTQTAENHPPLTIQKCTTSGGCQTSQHAVVLDSNWRWLHDVQGYTNCYTGDEWDTSLCPDPVTCAENCALDGADYVGTYGITSNGGELQLGFVTHGPYSTNIGSRVYLLQQGSESMYEMFMLKNQEFTFDVDVSQLPCGLNGALYFAELPQDGGMAQWPTNHAGAKYGTGYCDAQCPQDIKFIEGQANMLDWKPSPTDPNSGTGLYGTCCHEMDIWEANSMSNAFTPHPCLVNGLYKCNGTTCGAGDARYAGVCDKDGCDYNPYRMGNTSLFGPGSSFQIDTTQLFTVVTQFPTNSAGDVIAIRRVFVQNGKVVNNSFPTWAGIPKADNFISDPFCTAQKTVFGDPDDFAKKGGMNSMSGTFARGMVLVMSLWDDHTADMLWLDSDYPADKSATAPGVARGTCSTSSGVPADVERNHPNAYVKFMNIRTGDIGSTFKI